MTGSRKAQSTGQSFEKEIIATNEKYRMERVGVISKIPTDVRPIPSGKSIRWVPAGKTGCDFVGHYKGIPVAIESKSTANKTSFRLFTHNKEMIQAHQLKFLEEFEASGGKGYVFIKFNPIGRFFLVPVTVYLSLDKDARKAGKKSIPIKKFEEHEVKITDYLKGIKKGIPK